MKNPLVTLTSIGLLSLSTAAFAATPEEFQAADADGDGRLTFEEATTVHAEWTETEFLALDIDGDGTLTMEEYEQASN